MQSESNYAGIYNQLHKSGLFANANPDLLLKNMIPLTRVNQFFFGTNYFYNNLNYVILYNDNLIRKYYGIYWVNITNLEEYINRVVNIVSLDSLTCCPYNYYKVFKNTKKLHYEFMIKSIDAFLSYLDNKKTPEAKVIRHIITPNNIFETEIIDFLNFNNIFDNELLLKFMKKGKPLYIRLYFNKRMKASDGILRICDEITIEELDDLYEYIVKQLLLDSPEEFLINNLERICGSIEFAEIMVKSYLKKDEYIYNINAIASIILWKDEKIKQKYIEYFTSRYDCYCSILDDNIYINFKGINKFLLNISEDDVLNFEVKEQINEMYYNTMHELIYSFELLYKSK
jgi:hypothetical protein